MLLKNQIVKYDSDIDKEINIKVFFNLYRLTLFSAYYFYKFGFV